MNIKRSRIEINFPHLLEKVITNISIKEENKYE